MITTEHSVGADFSNTFSGFIL